MRIISVIFFIVFHMFISAQEIGIFVAPYERELIATLLSSYNAQTDSSLYFFTLWEVIDNHYKNPPSSNPSVVNPSSSDIDSTPQSEQLSLLKSNGEPYKRGPYTKRNIHIARHTLKESGRQTYRRKYQALYQQKIKKSLSSQY